MNKIKVLLLALLLLILPLQVDAAPVTAYCPHLISRPDSVLIWDMHEWMSITIDTPATFAPHAWDASRETWRGYNSSNPFGVPDDSYPERYNIFLRKAGQEDQWVWILTSKVTPLTDYVWIFQDISTHPDAAGNHNGTHPCAAFSIDASVVNNWFAQYTWKSEVPEIQYPLGN